MRVASRSITVFMTALMAIVFSLVLSGPAFSGMDCSDHMASGMAPGLSGQQMSHDLHQKMMMKGHEGSGMHLSSPDRPLLVIPGDCCKQVDCLTSPTVAAKIRFDVEGPVLVVHKVRATGPVHPAPLPARELFAQLQNRQGPPLLATRPYRAHLARTTRQHL